MNQMKNIQKTVLAFILISLFILSPSDSWSQRKTSKKNTTYSYHSNKDDDGSTRVRFKDSKNDFDLEFRGEIKVSDDDKDIVSISSGGFIEIRKSSFGSRRRIVIESGSNGQLIRSYYVGRAEKDYNTEGKAWLAEILPEIVRSTTIAAKDRVNRFYKRGGANAVLSEIRQMESDYVKATYFRLLLRNDLNNKELIAVIENAGSEIKSDHYLSGILQENQKAFLSSDQTITAYINATKSIKSDHYITNVLKKVINDSAITDNQMGSLLEISKNVQSDHYVTSILKEVMGKRSLNSQNVKRIIDLSKDIQSDHYKTEVLKKVINERSLSSDAYDAFIATLDDIQSDHYVSVVIGELLESKMDSRASSLSSLLNLVRNNVSSDHYATTIYKKLAKRNLSEDQLITALNNAANVNSDHYLSEILVAFSSKVNSSSESVKRAYRNAAKSIGSTSYYGKALKALD